MIPCFNFSDYLLVLSCPDAVIIILQVNHTPQPSRSVSEDKGGITFITLPVILIPFVYIWHCIWCHWFLVAYILSECMDLVLIYRYYVKKER